MNWPLICPRCFQMKILPAPPPLGQPVPCEHCNDFSKPTNRRINLVRAHLPPECSLCPVEIIEVTSK